MKFLNHIFKRHAPIALSILAILALVVLMKVFAVGPNYAPGETLDPAEGPGTAVVDIPTGWGLTGTSGTVDGTNFIGTTDNVPFNIRVNNLKAGRIDNTLSNTFWGFRAGNSNTTGASNTASGDSALRVNTTGSSNTANGRRALENNSTGESNTADGSFTLRSNTTGINNTAVGSTALFSNTIGNNNIALGYQAGDSVTSGSNNIIIGYDIDAPLATGSNQLSIGNLIFATGIDGTGTTISTGNVGIGTASPGAKLHIKGSTTSTADYALKIDDSSVVNLFKIHNSGQIEASDLVGNLFFGTSSGLLNTTGVNNIAVGYQTLAANTSGSLNTVIGLQALASNTEGNENTANGWQALFSNITGSGNTANGYVALRANTGDNNTAIGRGALYSNVTGSGSVALGYQAGVFETNSDGKSRLFIDNASRADEADGRIKALIYGIFDGDPANQQFTVNAATIHTAYLPTYVDNAAALTGGLVAGDWYLVTDAVTGSKIIEVVQ